MSARESKRPEPSHKAGKVRDKRIEELQHPAFGPEHLHKIIKKAATTPAKKRR
jgi:hypothetical protein